jgi:hypothetical protein
MEPQISTLQKSGLLTWRTQKTVNSIRHLKPIYGAIVLIEKSKLKKTAEPIIEF